MPHFVFMSVMRPSQYGFRWGRTRCLRSSVCVGCVPRSPTARQGGRTREHFGYEALSFKTGGVCAKNST